MHIQVVASIAGLIGGLGGVFVMECFRVPTAPLLGIEQGS